MDENKIRQIVREEMQRSDTSGQFKLQNIARHTHNGTDSLPVFTPTFTFPGYVAYDPTDPTLGLMLPAGWSARTIGVGQYEVTHNLNTFLYSVVVTASQSTNEKVAAVVTPARNLFYVFWFKLSDNSAANTSFTFALTQINNKTSPLINYTTRNFD